MEQAIPLRTALSVVLCRAVYQIEPLAVLGV